MVNIIPYIALGQFERARNVAHTLRIVQPNGNASGEVVQVLQYGRYVVHNKGRNAETFAVTPRGIERIADSSDPHNRIYNLRDENAAELGSLWLPGDMQIGQRHTMSTTLTYYDRNTQAFISSHPGFTQYITLVNVLPTWNPIYTFPVTNGLAVNDVIHLRVTWPSGELVDEMWYAKGRGLVGWRNDAGAYSYINGLVPGGPQRSYDVFPPLGILALPLDLPLFQGETPMTYTHQITALTGRVNVRGVPGGPVLYTLERWDQFTPTGAIDRQEYAGTVYTWHEISASTRGGKGWLADVNTLVVAPPLPQWVEPGDDDDAELVLGDNLLADDTFLSQPPIDVRPGGLDNQRLVAIPGGGYDFHIDRTDKGQWPFFMWNTDTGGYQYEFSETNAIGSLIAGRNVALAAGEYLIQLAVQNRNIPEAEEGNVFWGLRFNIGGQLYGPELVAGLDHPRFNAEDHSQGIYWVRLVVDEPVTFNSIGLLMGSTWPQMHGFLVPRVLKLMQVLSGYAPCDVSLTYPHDFPTDLPGPMDPDPEDPPDVRYIQLPELRVTPQERAFLHDVFTSLADAMEGTPDEDIHS